METREQQAPRVAGRLARVLRSPALAILLVAPFLGEVMSTSTPPLDLILPWNLALMAGLYGCGALLCREVARRTGLGLLGLCLLGAAYGVYEEALVDRYWFWPTFWEDSGVGSYSEVWHTNLLLATHLTAFHTAVSICASIVIVERLFPGHREQAWAGRGGLAFAAFVLFAVVPFMYGELSRGPGAAVLLAAAALCILLVVAAFLTRRLHPRRPRRTSRPRLLGWIAFAATATHFVLVYSLPTTGIPWTLGLALSLAPIAAGVLLIGRMTSGDGRGDDGLRVVTGILAFFVLLDIVVGIGGRYDLIAGAIATALFLWWLNRRDTRSPR